MFKGNQICKSVKSGIIAIATDKVYLNEDKKINFKENSVLGRL